MSDEESPESPESPDAGEESATAEEEESDPFADLTSGGDPQADDLKGMYQVAIMVLCYVVYCLYLYNRNAFLYTLPHIMSEGKISNFHITMIVAVQGCALAVSTLISGVLMEKLSIKLWCPLSLFCTGFFILGLSDTEDPQFMVILALLNGVAQGFAHVCIFTVLKNWYDPQSFGLLYGLLNTAINFIGLVGAYYASSWSIQHGWRTALQMPAVITMIAAPAVYYIIVDRPSTVSLEEPLWLPKPGEIEPVDWTEIVTSNLSLLLMPVYFCMSLVFTGTKDWGQMFLMEEMYLTAEATQGYGWAYETGCALGSMFFGAATDLMIKKRFWLVGFRKIRLFWVFITLTGSLLMLNRIFLSFDCSATAGTINVAAATMGFFMNGALTLTGIIIAEAASLYNTSSTIGIMHAARMWAMMIGGVPLSTLALSYTWGAVFMAMNTALVLCLFSLVMGRDLALRFTPEVVVRKV